MLQLIQATRRSDAKEFTRILSHHPNPAAILNMRDNDGWTLTHHAAYSNCIEIVAVVLEKGGEPLNEIPRVRNTPLHLALMSNHENSWSIAAMLHSKAFGLNLTPRANREGNHPLHLAAKVGNAELVKDLLKKNLEAKNIPNSNGRTPLGLAINGGHQSIADRLIEVTMGSPTQFKDFETIFRSFNSKAQKYLATIPVKIFVIGDNSNGKSTLIKSIQSESLYDRFWGISYNTPDVPNNKVGLVPIAHQSKKFHGKVIFYDLASGDNFVHDNLLNTADDLAHSMFIVVVDNRPEKKVMEQRLEFWLNFIHMQCSRFSTREIIYNEVSPHDPEQQRPNVLVISSFGELHNQKAFRNAPKIRLNQVVRSVTRHNREITQRLNVVAEIALDCRKAESPPMRQVRDELSRYCQQLRPQPAQLHSRCYILSDILRQLEERAKNSDSDEYDQLPIMKLSNLLSLVRQNSSDTETNLYQLLPQDSEELLELCKALEEVGRLIIVPSSHGDENAWIVYGKQTVANKLDELFVGYLSLNAEGQDKSAVGSTALMTSGKLEQCLQPVAALGMDLVTNLLEHFKIHDNSVREITKLPSDPHIFFFPTLLPMKLEIETWETEGRSHCFGWSIEPSKHQLSRFFLPRFTKCLLLLLFQRCGDAMDFEHRCLWSEGIHFQDKCSSDSRQLELTIIANSKAVILSMQFHSTIEVPALYLRNMILNEIRSLKESVQPEVKIEESLVPKNGTSFPIRSPSPVKMQYPIKELKKNISKSSLSLALSVPPSGISQISGSSESLNIQNVLPFFEPCLYLPSLNLSNLVCLLRSEYVNSELTTSFLQEFQRSIGQEYYKPFAEFFDLPMISTTPTPSMHSSDLSIVPVSPQERSSVSHACAPYQNEIARLPSVGAMCGCNTFGKLVECLNSISICNTVEFLADLQRAQISSNPTTSSSTPTRDSLMSSQQHPTALLTQTNALSRGESKNIYPTTTRSPSSSRSGFDLSDIHFVNSLDVITCGPAGGVFHSKSNNVTIMFPEGAVPSSMHSISIEFGVALFGPFDMPSNTEMRPVSPFVWICCDTPEFVFDKPITVVMPHCISCDSERDCEALTFMKADQNDLNIEGRFQFKMCDAMSLFRPHTMRGSCTTTHSGFLCICSENSNIVNSKANYCLMMVMPSRPEERYEVTFCITYLLETCMEVVTKQYPEENFKIQKKEVKLLVSPALQDELCNEAEIRIKFEPVLGEGWVAANISGHWEIPASSVAFWNRNIDTLKLLNRHKMYPPRFVIDINGTSAINASCLTVDFMGLRKRVQFQITLSYQRLQRRSSGPFASHKAADVLRASMSEDEFIAWLQSRGVSRKDCEILTENGVTPAGFSRLEEEDFEGLGLSIIGKKLVQKALKEPHTK